MNLNLPLAACPPAAGVCRRPRGANCFLRPCSWLSVLHCSLLKTFSRSLWVSIETQQLLLRHNSISQTSTRLCSFSRCYEPNIAKNARDWHGLFPLQRLNRVETGACWQQVWLNERKCSPMILQSWHPSTFPAQGAGFRSLGRMAGLLL